MDYPHSHVSHNHHHRRNDDDDNYPPPPPPPFSSSPIPPPSYGGEYNHPPPSYGGDYNPPPPSYGGAYNPPPHSYGGDYNPPPPSYGGDYNPPPPHHQTSSHHGWGHGNEEGGTQHSFRPHMPAFMEGHFHHGSSHDSAPQYGGSDYGNLGGPGVGLEMGCFEGKPSYKMVCKASGDRYAVAVREGKLVLTHPNDADLSQHWYKDESFSIKVKDKDGYPSFILVNRATGQAVKHSVSGHPVQLVPYKPGVFDESIMWTESKDLGSGYRTIRMINNVKLVLDAFNGDENHGGIHDGTFLALFESWRGDNKNQQWKLIPY